MSLVIEGKRLGQDTGVQDRKLAGEIFAAWGIPSSAAWSRPDGRFQKSPRTRVS